MNVNVNLTEQSVIQINSWITISVDVTAKKFMYMTKNMFGILLNIIARIGNIYQVLWIIQQLSVMKL